MAWLATMFGGVKYAMSGSSAKPTATATPPINASSSDEADFIKCANSTPRLLSRCGLTRRQGLPCSGGQEELDGWIEDKCSNGCVDAVYFYKSWRHELSIEPDSRVQIPTKAGFANRGMTILKNRSLPP